MSQFTWKAQTSDSKGLVVLEYPPIAKPPARTQVVTIPGRSGDLTLYESTAIYDPYVRTCRCLVEPGTSIDALNAWLTGKGDVIFGNESAYAYEAEIIDEIKYEVAVRGQSHRIIEIPFKCQPLKKLATTEADIVKTTNGTIANPGTVTARPLLLVDATGDVTLAFGTYLTTITGMAAPIYIDSDAGIATNVAGTANASYMVSGDWPMIAPGTVAYSKTGSVTSVTITPRWRYT